MSDEWLDNLKVGDKVFVESKLHIVEKITPTRQIKVDGIERRFIKGQLKGAMQWDSSRYLRESTPGTEIRINAVKLRMNRVRKVSRASVEMFDNDVLKLLSNFLTKKAQSMTSVRKGDVVTYTRCNGLKPNTGCKVISDPYIEGKLVYVTIERMGNVPVMTLTVEKGDEQE